MRKNKETIATGIISLLISQVLIKIIGLAYKLYLTNKEGFGDSGNAIYSAGFQIYALLLTLSSTGVPNAISKLVAERLAIGDNKGAHKIFKIAFFTFAIFGLIGTTLLFFCAKIIANEWLEIPEAEYSIISLSPSIFFVSITSVIRGYFNGMQKLSVTAKSQTIEQIFKTSFTIIFVEIVAKLTKNNTMIMSGVANLATTAATFFSFTYIFMYYRSKRKEIGQDIAQTVNYTPTRIRKTLKKILNESIPISLSSLMSSFNKNIDLFTVVRLLKKFLDEREAKIQYGILSGKIDTLCILPLSLNVPFVTGMVPTIAKNVAKKDNEELRKNVQLFLKITILIAMPSTVGIIVFAEPILNLLFPNANSGTTLLQINGISIIFMMMAQTINGILQAIGKNKVPLISYTIGIILKIIINVILVGNKKIGIIGAAIGNIICNLAVCIIGYVVLKKHIKIKLKKVIIKIIFATIIMTIVSIILKNYINRIIFKKLATIVSILLTSGAYIAAVIVLKLMKY